MGRTFQSGIISRLVVGGGTYAVLHNETQIDVDNSNGLPTIIKLQPIDPSLGQCTVYINDYGNNSSVGNITIVASGGNLINGQPTLVLDTDGIGAEISVADQKSFIASLNNDSQGGGGTITGAFNGLSVSGTNIILGGALTMPTTIDALGSNTFSINDQAGLMFKTRDALGNFFFNNIGGTGTLVGSSQYIFSYLGDGGNVFTDSLIVINFGGANHFTQAVDFWNFGDYTQANLSSSIFNIGRFNHFDNVSSTTVMGYSNDLNAVYSSTILGSGNTYSGLNQKFILGNNNKNLFVDGVTGYVGIDVITPSEILEANGNIKLSSTAHVYKIGVYNALSITQNVGGSNVIIGHGNTMNDASNGGGIVIGTFATSTSDGIAIGLSSFIGINTEDGIAIGREATVNNASIRGFAVGRQATVSASNAFAIGNYTLANVDNTIILGNNSLGVKPNIGIGLSNPNARLDVQGDALNPLFKLNNSNFLFADKLKINNDGNFYSGSINAFGGFGTANFETDHLNYNFRTSYSTYFSFTNAQGSGNKSSYGIIGGSIGFADSDYKLAILNSDAGTLGSILKLTSTASSTVNDGFDYNHYGINLTSGGIFNNTGAGNFYKTGLNIDITGGDINRAIKVVNGVINVVKANQPAYGTLMSGDFYYDTAANILANGDFVVGMKA